jgi:NAD dependent epimerase/dehydratase family enzyme
MKIVLAGGTGQIGGILRRAFAQDEVIVLARSSGVRWDGRTLGSWAGALDGADALINLAGRTVLLRSAMVMSPDRGGVFDTLRTLVRRGLGGPAAGGRQFVSWIHDVDFAGAIRLLIEREELAGPVNLAAPNPLPYRDFMAALRRAEGVPFGLPAARWMLELGAWAMRTETELVLKSRRVVPGVLTGAGFAFSFPEWPAAARDLVARRRAS